jgi:hypothetical protein
VRFMVLFSSPLPCPFKCRFHYTLLLPVARARVEPPVDSISLLEMPNASVSCSQGYLLGDWVGFRRELAATEKGYKDIVHLLERIATNLPYGFQLKLSSMPFFAFKDPYLERGYREVLALRKNQCNACRSHACLYALVVVLFIYAYATCDIDKELHRRQWVATSAVCGLSLLLAPAALVGTNWCLKSMQKQVERYGQVEFEDELYMNSRNARRLSMVSDLGFRVCCFEKCSETEHGE